MSDLPHIKKPCGDCPFRKDALQGWLGSDQVAGILAADSFVCHKKRDMQCAGHMLINGNDNAFVRLAQRLNISLNLSGRDQIFESKAACIEHHSNSRSCPVDAKAKLITPGELNKRLISTIKAAVRTSEVAHTCEWLISEGMASDEAHARELVNSAINA